MSKILSILALLAVISTTVEGAAASPSIGDVSTPGLIAPGNQSAQSANYAVVSSVGQPLTGQGVSGSNTLCSGYWCQIPALYRVLLPQVIRS